MPKVLITGASGFVGSWLVKEALNRGWDTYAGIRSTSSRALLQDKRINEVIIDFSDDTHMRKVLSEHDYDFIIHNAGVTRAQQDSTYFKVNSEYSKNFAQLAIDVLGDRLRKFVFISSIEAFGSADGTPDDVVDHNITPKPRTTYGLSKLRAEKELKTIKDLPLIILRPTAVFGPAEKDFFAFWKTIKTYRVTPTIGNKDIKYTFVYVKDLVRVVMDAADSDIQQKAYFVSDGRIHKMGHFLSHIAKSLKKKTLSFTIPYLVIDTAVSITSLFDKVTGQKSLLNAEQVAKAKAQNWDCDISDLVTDLNFSPKYTLEEGVKETTDWYLEQGWI